MVGINVKLRRLLFAVPVLALTLLGSYAFYTIIRSGGVSGLELGMMGVFSITLIWIAMWFWNAIIGLTSLAFSRNVKGLAAPILDSLDRAKPIECKTAIVMPIHNEDPERTFLRLEATWRSLLESCADTPEDMAKFDFFLLSDTTDLSLAEQELVQFARLKTIIDPENLHYRRRDLNTGRKAGNIEDFGRRWGHHYDTMVVLDADSLMSGRLLRDLALLMDANPAAGIIQTVPRPILARSVFGRLQQFAARSTAEIVNAGVSFWQLGDANYFGHNAIIRTRAFFEHCSLSTLSGTGPLSGEILSHDFVEAAYIRRGGYKVWNIPVGDGSYEEVPPTLIDYAVRDRRWCQGNLQHMRIIGQKGLNPLSRLHLLSGIMSYIASPLWLAFIVMSVIDLILRCNPTLSYHGPGSAHFSLLPNGSNSSALVLFAAIMAMLILPKVFGGFVLMLSRREREGYGRRAGILVSLFLEIFQSILMAPVMMVLQTGFILSVFTGRNKGWQSQNRESHGLSVKASFKRLAPVVVFGLTLLGFLIAFVPHSALWFLPLVVGPILSPWLASVTSSERLGDAIAAHGLFLTPEETMPERAITALQPSPKPVSMAPATETAS